jgi:hypothetical protein
MRHPRRTGAVVAVLFVAGLALWNLRPRPGSIEVIEDEPKDDSKTPTAPISAAKNPTAKATAVIAPDAGMPEPRTGGGSVIAEFGWGNGDGKLGHSRPDEANPEAPMSLTVDALGNVWILDQVNERLVKLDKSGKQVGTVPLTVQAGQDVVVGPDGTVMVLDRLVDKSVAIIGADGKPRGELPLIGKGLEEGGASTGVFVDGNEVVVEREHGDSVRIGSTSGEAAKERTEVPGRPAGDGRTYLTAGIVDAATGMVMVTAIDREPQAHRFTRQLSMGQPVVALNALDADRSGIIYLGTVLELPGSTPEQPVFGIAVLCLDPLDGRPLGQTRFAANTMPEETFREMTVLPEGGVLFLERTASGSRVVRYGCGS